MGRVSDPDSSQRVLESESAAQSSNSSSLSRRESVSTPQQQQQQLSLPDNLTADSSSSTPVGTAAVTFMPAAGIIQ